MVESDCIEELFEVVFKDLHETVVICENHQAEIIELKRQVEFLNKNQQEMIKYLDKIQLKNIIDTLSN